MWVTVIALVALCAPTEAEVVHRISSFTARSFFDKFLLQAFKDFKMLTATRNITLKEMKEKELEWGEKYGLRKDVEEFYQTQTKKAEEIEQKTIAVLENALKAYREYLALFDDSKTLEQIDKEEEKLRSEKPKEYSVFMHASRIVRTPNLNLIWPAKKKFGTDNLINFIHPRGMKLIGGPTSHAFGPFGGPRRQKLEYSLIWP